MKLKSLFFGKRLVVGLCLFFLCVCAVTAIFAPWIAPHDPNQIRMADKLVPSSAEHLLGTDHLGRDVLSRLIYGVRSTFGLVLGVFSISVLVGVSIGMLSGYVGGWLDQLLMRICDGMLAFPNLVLVLGIVGMLGPGIYQVIIALLLVQWVYYARMTRGLVLHLRSEPYLLAALICGSSRLAILRRHVFPHIFPQIVVIGTLEMGWAIMDISALSFLGLGIQPPTAEWGAMINEGRGYLREHPSLMLYPGLCILLVVTAFNVLGESLSQLLGVKKVKERSTRNVRRTSRQIGNP
ncbi:MULTISPECIES: nickel transporter permease [unclassified Paenibacillus]|uniref:nickel transporter permease n=1 Tax=unclassified Paenibacillus TaxID=185978 RepID=UPI0030D612D9